MKFSSPLQRVKLIKRYKRFLADVITEEGETFTVHTANTGQMLGCAEPGSYIWIRDSHNLKRKYRHSWEISETVEGVKIGVNTGFANHLVREAIEEGTITELWGYDAIKAEVPYGKERSRIDFLLSGDDREDCFVEVKSVTARVGDKAIFPDAVSARGAKHLRELRAMVAEGKRGVIFFCIQRDDVDVFRPADEIDPNYADTLRQVVRAGVEVLAYRADISVTEIKLMSPVKVVLT